VRARRDSLGQIVLNPEQLITARKVGQYATTNGDEFVAEVFSGLVSKRKYSANILKLYQDLGGPIPQAWTRIFIEADKKLARRLLTRKKLTTKSKKG
jgi:hypothetical protein